MGAHEHARFASSIFASNQCKFTSICRFYADKILDKSFLLYISSDNIKTSYKKALIRFNH